MTTAATVGEARDEFGLQCLIVQHVNRHKPSDLFFTAIPMGEKRKPSDGLRVRMMGGRKGAPDLVFVRGGKALFLEVKFGHGAPSPEQVVVFRELELAGAYVFVARSLEQAVEILTMSGMIDPAEGGA